MSRPAFHLTPPRGWMNDPVGITWHDGRYHVFFQQVEHATSWAPSCAWGHATTTDFVTWEHLPVALAPGDGDDGCWSGCLVADGPGEPLVFYSAVTAGHEQLARIRVATPTDAAWTTWRKHEVVAEAPAELDLVVFRDPVVQRDGDSWLMLVGGGLADGTACVLAYRSDDLRAWRYDGLLASRRSEPTDPWWTGRAWECPQLVRTDQGDVLVVSTWADDVTLEVLAAVGSYADGRFAVARWQRLGHGPAPYAATAFRDAEGHPVLMAWLRGVEDHDAGWAGAQGVPLRVGVVDGEVRLEVHPALGLATRPADGEPASAWDLAWRPEPGDEVSLRTDDHRPLTLRHGDDHLVVHHGDDVVHVPSTTGAVRVLVDGPVLEVVTGPALFATALPGAGPMRVHHDGSGELVVGSPSC